jgi:hypothetical protein
MSESFWEPEVAIEPQPEEERQESRIETGALAVSADDFAALEERILRAVELVRRERQARGVAEERAALAEQRATQAEAQLREQGPVAQQMQAELTALRAERDHVRQRVERLLTQLDGLEL